jgi:hypothetical protein
MPVGEPAPEDGRKFQFIEHYFYLPDRTDEQIAFEALRAPEMVFLIYCTGEQ